MFLERIVLKSFVYGHSINMSTSSIRYLLESIGVAKIVEKDAGTCGRSRVGFFPPKCGPNTP